MDILCAVKDLHCISPRARRRRVSALEDMVRRALNYYKIKGTVLLEDWMKDVTGQTRDALSRLMLDDIRKEYDRLVRAATSGLDKDINAIGDIKFQNFLPRLQEYLEETGQMGLLEEKHPARFITFVGSCKSRQTVIGQHARHDLDRTHIKHAAQTQIEVADPAAL